MVKYTFKILAICIGIAIATFLLVFTLVLMSIPIIIVCVLSTAAFGLAMYSIGKRYDMLLMPQDALKRYFPFFLPMFIVCVFLLVKLIASWRPLPLNSQGYLEYSLLYLVMGAMLLISAGLLTVGAYFRDKTIVTGWRRFAILPGVILVFCLMIFGLDTFHASHSLREGGRTERVEEELSLSNYEPFKDGNHLAKADFTPSLVISSNYPRLDGATAAYPVYSAMAETVYVGLDAESVKEYVLCSKTDGAFERLIAGETDIIFGVQPSEAQLDLANESGIILIPIKVSQEAFVFFVSTQNPIDNLTVEQIQWIYTKKVTNWNELGGKSGEIIPYQRAKNSGSQTIMENLVMKDTAMAEPFMDERMSFMGGMMSAVASYQNYSGAIGYSFRYYATVMNPSERLRILSVNGISPSPENIRNSTYPFVVDVYAYTTEQAMENPNVEALLEWIISDEGQKLIELCGYVSAKAE